MRLLRVVVAATLLMSVLVGAGVARADVEDRGECSGGGAATWRLRVQREDRAHLRVRYEVRASDGGERWQIFVSDDGARVLVRTRAADDSGDVSVRVVIRDRAGRDRIAASAVNLDDGETCSGSVRF